MPDLYGCEIWSLTPRKEHRLKVFENRILWKIMRPRRNKVTGECRRLYNELYDLYSSPHSIWVIKSRRIRWVGHVAHVGDRRSAYRVLEGRLQGKRPLGIHGRIMLKWIIKKWYGMD